MKTDKKILIATIITILLITSTNICLISMGWHKTVSTQSKFEHQPITESIKTLVVETSWKKLGVHLGKTKSQEFHKQRGWMSKLTDSLFHKSSINRYIRRYPRNLNINGDTLFITDQDSLSTTDFLVLHELENLIIRGKSKVKLFGVADTTEYVAPDLNIFVQDKAELKIGWGWRSYYHLKLMDESETTTQNPKVIKSAKLSGRAKLVDGQYNPNVKKDHIRKWIAKASCQGQSYIKYRGFVKTKNRAIEKVIEDGYIRYIDL